MYKTALLAALAAALAYYLFPLLDFKAFDVLTSLNLTTLPTSQLKNILKTEDMAATSLSRRVVQKVLAVETAEVGVKRACPEV